MSQAYALENGATAVYRVGQYVNYAIFHFHLGLVPVEHTACGRALGLVKPVRIKLAGRTCVSFCMWEAPVPPDDDPWVTYTCFQEMARMTAACHNQLCLAMYGNVAYSRMLRYDIQSNQVQDPIAHGSGWQSKFRIFQLKQKTVLDETRGFRVSMSALAEAMMVTVDDFNRGLLTLLGEPELVSNVPWHRALFQRMVTLNV